MEKRISRRRMLQRAVQGPVTATVAAAALTQQLPLRAERNPRIGAHLWVFSAKQPDYDATPILEQVFRDVKEGGLDGIELMHQNLLHEDAVYRIRNLSRKYSLPVMGSSWSAPMWEKSRQEQVLKEADVLTQRIQSLGGWVLGISVGDARRKKTAAEFDAQAELLSTVIELARRRGIRANLHNHVYEVADGEYDLRNTLQRVPEARLGPDFNWLRRAKVDPVQFIQTYGNRIIYAHLRDEKADGKWSEAMGEGVMDYAAIGQALRQVGFTGDLAIELAHERDFTPTRPLSESLRISREYIRKTMGW
jgi:sugar phosphate isomerase/epimerase